MKRACSPQISIPSSKACFQTYIAQPVAFCNILDKCEQVEHLFQTQSVLQARLEKKQQQQAGQFDAQQ